MSTTGDHRNRASEAGLMHLPVDLPFWAHIRFFFGGLPTPRFMTAMLVVFVVARIALGAWMPADALFVVLLLAAYPFIEWTIHKFILHWRPRAVRGRMIDPGVARNHRDHHRNPDDLVKNLSDTGRNMITVYVGAAVVGFTLTRDLRLTLDAVIYVASFALIYEWAHYLIHSNYRPGGRYLRILRRGHLRHHFRNEQYWYGVAANVADLILRTSPQLDQVEVSTTARHPDMPPEALGD
jgi:hypothetical protein